MSDQFYSVTSLIKLGLGTSGPLVHWNAKMPAETAYDKFKTLAAFREDNDRDGAVKWLMDSRWKKSGDAAARGTDVHTAAEALALVQTPEVEDHILPYVEQYRAWLDRFVPAFVMSEAAVYNPRYRYAGTCDGVMDVQGRRVIFDLKTTDRGPETERMRPPYSEIALQLCAYARAELVGVLAERVETQRGRYYVYNPANQHEPMPAVDGALAIVISPSDCRAIPVRIDDDVWRAFGAARAAAMWQTETSKTVFGPEITATAKEEVAA